MKYDDLTAIVLSTSASQWHSVEGLHPHPHNNLAVYKADVRLSVAWGEDHMDGDSWDEPWSHVFPDKKIYGWYADLRWEGQPIHRELLLGVDGHRATLPAGSPVAEAGKGIVGMEATALETAIARLVHTLQSGTSDFDEYMTRANITLK